MLLVASNLRPRTTLREASCRSRRFYCAVGYGNQIARLLFITVVALQCRTSASKAAKKRLRRRFLSVVIVLSELLCALLHGNSAAWEFGCSLPVLLKPIKTLP
jgi:hypothetical protein